jgi:Xaa-Pro aminopeptidase
LNLCLTKDDYAARMARATHDAVQAGLSGLIVAPGPDLVWLTGYRPTAITERLTILVLSPDHEPTLLVPVLERPDAECRRARHRRRQPRVRAAEGAPPLSIVDWADATDPYTAASTLLRPDGRFGLDLGAASARPATMPGPRQRVSSTIEERPSSSWPSPLPPSCSSCSQYRRCGTNP